jgi:5-oxoprolinase (ATP-hydrolysing)
MTSSPMQSTPLNFAAQKWQFWIDRGGTFTDIVARQPDGALKTAKLLSENPEQYQDAAVEGIKRLLGISAGALINSEQVEVVKMGTTVATNALLERKGEPVLLVVTNGFADALRIAYQNRPKLFERRIVLPELLYKRVMEVQERLNAKGEIEIDLAFEPARINMQAAFDTGLRSIAIVLMHAYLNPVHEKRLAVIAKEIGFTQISVSHEASPLVKYVARGDTTVVDAYLSPVLRRYVDQVASQMPNVRLQFMQSNGGLTDAKVFQGKDAILSGPAGGIVGMARVSQIAGFSKVIGFDMGGTSTDVSHFDGEFERAFDTLVAGVRVRAPMMSIHTVAAGGGSILHFDGARLRVGPDSAGANPGPACYRRGGPLTVTDANVMLGKIQPAFFPAVFGPKADQTLDAVVVREKFQTLANEVAAATGKPMTSEALAQGYIDIAVANMANAIKKISVQRGYDVTQYTLTTFGGAGGQHACLVADALAMQSVLAHPLAGVLSAYGMGLATQTAMREKSVEVRLDAMGLAAARQSASMLAEQATDDLVRQGEVASSVSTNKRLLLRYEGTDTALSVHLDELATTETLTQAFELLYKQRFAFLMAHRPLVIESAVVEACARSSDMGSGQSTFAPSVQAADSAPYHPENRVQVQVFMEGKWRTTPVFQRDSLAANATVDGPAVIAEANATTAVEIGWQAKMTAAGDLVLKRIKARVQQHAAGTTADPVLLEIFNNLFMSIAEQMGYRLQNTAHSVNIKERLDFSCAVFDEMGQLVANAPHMPVHLGSMGASISAVIDANQGSICAGDVYVLNDPYAGGTHLPDVTVVTPVFNDDGTKILFYVGSRGHHADIGGTTPGSMPPDSKTIDEEGVLLTNFKLISAGVMREKEFKEALETAPFPTRNTEQNLADLRAQVAANEKGREELIKMVQYFGLDVVRAYMRHVQDNAEESVRRVIGALKDGRFEVSLDNGAKIKVAIRVDASARSAEIDFTGTSPQQANNFNAPRAVTYAAVLYVFRSLVDDEIPMNQGCLKPLKVIVPEGCMLNPVYPAAVVAGNVETSTCITNAIYGALGTMGSSQPTVNNFTFGNAKYQYYETISGGSGAGDGYNGTSVVQTHMTNSRLTDPEILELRFPVQLESYVIKQGSGGRGRWQGGNGGIRKIKFLEAMTASILSNGRVFPAFGAQGGGDGALGLNYVIRKSGERINLTHADKAELSAGDTFVIETPGGGGYGASD